MLAPEPQGQPRFRSARELERFLEELVKRPPPMPGPEDQNQGQVCAAGSRLFVHPSIHKEVVEAIAEEAQGIVLGHGLAPDTQMGPLVSDVQLARVAGLVDSGKQQGATVVCGGERPGGELAAGYFMQPTVFADVQDDMRIAGEEIFGPVLSVFSFEEEEEVVARANASRYGLVAAVWTNDLTTEYVHENSAYST